MVRCQIATLPGTPVGAIVSSALHPVARVPMAIARPVGRIKPAMILSSQQRVGCRVIVLGLMGVGGLCRHVEWPTCLSPPCALPCGSPRCATPYTQGI
jgi:hypothetical protein